VPRLRVISGPETGRETPVESSATIGRSSTCDLVLGSDEVSRRHAEIVLRDGQWIIRDLGTDSTVKSSTPVDLCQMGLATSSIGLPGVTRECRPLFVFSRGFLGVTPSRQIVVPLPG